MLGLRSGRFLAGSVVVPDRPSFGPGADRQPRSEIVVEPENPGEPPSFSNVLVEFHAGDRCPFPL